MSIIEVNAGYDIGEPTPVRIETTGAALPDGDLVLQPENGGPCVPAQRDGTAVIALIARVPAGRTQRYQIQAASGSTSGVTLRQGESTLDLQLPQGNFATYHFGSNVPRPFLWPVLGPDQKPVTRAFPMEQHEGEVTDHPHHRSMWTAFEEVNGASNWHEGEGHGFTRHQKFLTQEQGPVFGGFTAASLWTNKNDEPVLSETRRIHLYNIGEALRLLDYEVTFAASHGDLEFGETKEAGVLAVRVATSMDGAHGGMISNSEGGRGEAECWGKRAAWCDYSGLVDDETMGIAIFDHPSNPNFPTRWHVRDYGLFATNPFSTAAFNAGEATPFYLKDEESVKFGYRVLIHRGDTQQGGVARAYEEFVDPPRGHIVG